MFIDIFAHPSSWDHLQASGKLAETLGFSNFCMPEITSDPFMALTAVSLATQRIGLRTAIAVAFPRSPMVVAGSAWSLHTNTKGRFVLGLGTQVKGHNERRFSVPWGAPAQRLREYVESLRAIWRCWELGEKLNYQGEHYQFSLMTPEFSPPRCKLGPIPVYLAAVRPIMLKLAGSVGDGVRLHGFCTKRYLEEVALPQLEEGLAQAGRDRSQFEICGGGFIATGPDEEAVMKMREWIRYRIAFYGSTRTYAPVMELHGWNDLANKLHIMSKEGKWAEMAKEIPNDVLETFSVAGTYAELPNLIEQRFGGLSDTVELGVVDENPEHHEIITEVLTKLKKIPTKFAHHGSEWR
jgi:probable F420-dependent oxidoreductase